MAVASLEVNGRRHDVDVPPATPLLSVLRDSLGLMGARFGCGHGACGACVVLVDGNPVPACTTRVAEVGERPIVTIEGLARDGQLHPVQRAFLDEGALQCGYCTSGMILAAAALLDRAPHPTEDQIREALSPHLCRCGIYLRAIHAVQRAAR
jgi:aerobic-type carbon monoxide dehydrogenase small subunit (CoxS/CutS family)